MVKGAFLVIEGIDGAGKSTLCDIMKRSLQEEGRKVIVTQEPTHDEIGAFIRRGAVKNISQKGEALLFVADRAVHTERISKWLEEGRIVICDRYFASTVAYQSVPLNGVALEKEWLLSLNMPVIREPDLTVLLDIDPTKGLKRIGDRGEISKFENDNYLKGVRERYLELAKEFGFLVLNAERKQADLSKEILDELMRRL
jgi:thymidylate kinase